MIKFCQIFVIINLVLISQVSSHTYCKVQETTMIKYESTSIDNVNGIHQDINSNEAVDMLWVRGTIFYYIPARIGHYLTNLQAIWIHQCGLKVLKYENLKQFPKLRYIYAGQNQLEVLASDVFKGNPNIEWIDLQKNKLKFIDGEIFTVFPLMQNLNLKKNYCVDQHHYGKVGHIHFEQIKHEIDMNCHLPNEIFCAMQEMSHQGENYYTCSGKGTAINNKNVTISRILHNQNLTIISNPLNETQGLHIRYQNFSNFPRNLHEFLPNLIAIQIIGSQLKELNSKDIKNYKDLKSLWLPLNHIENLNNSVFAYNEKLEKLSFYGNRLKFIKSQILMPLKFLKFVSFEKNICIDIAAENSEKFDIIRSEIIEKCN
ncbi:hypothetical protein PVAND_016990 [Polypedilum vanderplanki]|uniref:Uncharacterized protein n=1 Tax=Polypedilum vanderplanki TaxID=319348 RepID=A0A9J6BH04_POLVA|nr:hypothetical protein PVAND_016990 [Polypedilum vanderplanki]